MGPNRPVDGGEHDLGGMSGIELHEQLAKLGSTTPVIFLTAHHESALRERAKKTGFAAFLGKNDPCELVLAAIDRAIWPQERVRN